MLPLLSCRSFSPRVEFCGYSNPHPSENKIHLRIQMYGKLIPSDTASATTTDSCTIATEQTCILAGGDEKKGSYVPFNLPGCLELDEVFFKILVQSFLLSL